MLKGSMHLCLKDRRAKQAVDDAKQLAGQTMTKQLAGGLDLEVLGKNFGRFAGADNQLDREE